MTRTVKVRFAPSPTGNLHVGNARVALMNWAYARTHGGIFILRMDDTDTLRSTKAYEKSICDDLKWLGCDYDDFFRQSARQSQYDMYIQKLKDMGRLYPCFETPEELELKRKVQLGRGLPPVYDRSALKLSAEEQVLLAKEGRSPHWRFQLSDKPVIWQDMGRGEVHFEGGHLSDPVLLREDGRPLYTLTSVVDDGEYEITHVIRGEDHVANTAVQIELFQALGFAPPTFAHMPLMVGADGKQLSKRLGSLALADLRNLEPQTLVAYLLRLGTSHAADGNDKATELLCSFHIDSYGRASPRYNGDELTSLNAKMLHHMDYAGVQARLPARVDEAFWQAIRGNIDYFDDHQWWYDVVYGEQGLIDRNKFKEDGDYLDLAAQLLPKEPWESHVYKQWIDALKSASGRKGKDLFMPLRLALTGRTHGPELSDLLPLMGPVRVMYLLTGRH